MSKDYLLCSEDSHQQAYTHHQVWAHQPLANLQPLPAGFRTGGLCMPLNPFLYFLLSVLFSIAILRPRKIYCKSLLLSVISSIAILRPREIFCAYGILRKMDEMTCRSMQYECILVLVMHLLLVKAIYLKKTNIYECC